MGWQLKIQAMKLSVVTSLKNPYGIAVNKNQARFRNKLNWALREVEKDGTYNRLLLKWFGNVKGFNYQEMKR